MTKERINAIASGTSKSILLNHLEPYIERVYRQIFSLHFSDEILKYLQPRVKDVINRLKAKDIVVLEEGAGLDLYKSFLSFCITSGYEPEIEEDA
jgi:hypothetical protein